jgi:hypothetical protein
VLRVLEDRSLPAVRPAGIVVQPFEDTAVLVTHYLAGSWQYRRLFLRLPSPAGKHRDRLFDAMAALLVDLHRSGVFWGDCSLANTLFKRDGQRLQAWMVDAETSDVYPSLSDGQRATDLQIMVENVAGGLLDVAARLGESPDALDQIVEATDGIVERYRGLWDALHEEPAVRLGDRHEIESRLRRLNDLGFVVDEVQLVDGGAGAHRGGRIGEGETVRLRLAVAERGYHSEQFRAVTGLDAGEGQATILLNDLRSFQARELAAGRPEGDDAVHLWVDTVFRPGMVRAHEALGGVGDPIQAYCDLLEVRWLLSEQAGDDVGDEPALAALHQRSVPVESAAAMAIADVATRELPAIVVDDDGDESPPGSGLG